MPTDNTIDPEVSTVLERYPVYAREKLLYLRKLILETAEGMPEVDRLEETLKWGEPSYLAKHGSTLRMDWKEKAPDQYAMYFKCTSKLVPSFKAVFGDLFRYEGDRAIVFGIDENVPEEALKRCIQATLRYHKVKQLPYLGIPTP